MSFAVGIEGAIMLCPWLREDIHEGDKPKLRWLRWGYIYPIDSPGKSEEEARWWYIAIGLPIFQMRERFWVRNGGYSMHQKFLIFVGRLPTGREGWEARWFECESA